MHNGQVQEFSCGFRSHPRECVYASGSIRNLSIVPEYSQNHIIGITEKDRVR